MKVLIRTDASLSIGSGHVHRCLTLARAMRAKGAEVLFASREHSGHLIDLIQNAGFQCLRLVAPRGKAPLSHLDHGSWLGVTQSEDSRQLMGLLPGRVDWLVIDHYALDEEWEKAMRPHVGSIFVIDDLADRAHDCELILNQNLYLDMDVRYRSKVPSRCVQLMGPTYALLRDEFSERRLELEKQGRAVRDSVRRILISYGGVDASNETGKAIEALILLDLSAITQVDVVVGSQNPHRKNLEKQIVSHGSPLVLHQNTSNLASMMAQADLALGAGGTMTWERCSVGLPSVVTILSKNQEQIARIGEKAGFQRVVGWNEQVTSKEIASLVQQLVSNPDLLRQMSKDAWKTVDAKGTFRVVERIIKSGE